MTVDLKQTFLGRHTVNIKITGSGSEKDTRHHEIAMDGAPVIYLPGDALGVHPQNSPALVDRIVKAVDATGDELVPGGGGTLVPFAQALQDVYSLSTPSRQLFELLLSRGAEDMRPLIDRGHAELLKHI